MMNVRHEVIPFLAVAVTVGVLCGITCFAFKVSPRSSALAGGVLGAVLIGYFLYFFRDPDRVSPGDDSVAVSGADGVIAGIKEVREEKHLKADAVRVSIFLSLFDVHVNRAPISGKSRFLGYFPGKHFFTFKEKSSEYNQHNEILITGKTRCLVNQIVGPVCRRVVYWPDHDKEVELKAGDRIGMMKFGSRLDMYFPKDDVDVLVKEGDIVRAGVTVVAKLKTGGAK
jgi:phosphatidylserine decarboxylase